jgi:hypothetical protein
MRTKRYRFCLSQFGQKDKVVIASTYDIERALELVKEQYPNWTISQFWVVWPF